MSKSINGADYPIKSIFSSEFDYSIPSYQRPYAWTTEEASELFDDLLEFYQSETDESYFLGSIVLIKEENNPKSEVIDGQQRLTTLTILLASIASFLSDKQLKDDYEQYIRERGRPSQKLESKPRLALRSMDQPFFSEHVQSLQFEKLASYDSKSLPNEAQRNIQANSRLFQEKLKTVFNDEQKLCDFGSFVVEQCYLVAVSTSSQKSAFRVFSVLNNRGLDLLPIDIIKAEIIGKIASTDQDEYTQKWEDLEVQTGRNRFNDLFGYIRMIFAKEKAKKALLEEFQTHVLSIETNPKNLIDSILEPYTEAYLAIRKQQYVSTEDANKINLLLKWLSRINNSDWIPPAILFISQKKDDSKYVHWFVRKLERLAAYLHICAKNINQRIERYSEVLNALEIEHSLAKPISAIELNDSEKTEFIQVLSGRIYDLTAIRRNYVILRLDSFISDSAAYYDPTVLTIEHVLPQTVSKGSQWEKDWPDEEKREEWTHRIANLVPLTQKRNSKARNFDFAVKKTAYFGGAKGVSSYILTTQVLGTDVWTPSIVEERQGKLLEVLKEKWELND